MEVKTNTMLVITPKMNLLQIPIVDEFWVGDLDPEAGSRSTDYAISMGFGECYCFLYLSKNLWMSQYPMAEKSIRELK